MRVHAVTLTGADDGVDPSALTELTHIHPYVEWGILFSKTREGTARYPTREWIENLCEQATAYYEETSRKVKFAAHLCGEYARQFIAGYTNTWLDDWDSASSFFQRIQLNISDDDFLKLNFKKLAFDSFQGATPWKEIIIQTKQPFERAGEAAIANDMYRANLSMLYDASGGRGVAPASWPGTYDCNVRFGYAGGINPENVGEVIQILNKKWQDQDVWIDMETGVRENDRFSLEKCREVLNCTSGFIDG